MTASINSSDSNTIIVNILSALPEGDPQGSFAVKVSLTASGRDLLRLLCSQAQVPVLPSYVLQTHHGDLIGLDRPVSSIASIQEGKVLHWNSTDDPHVSVGRCWNVYWLLGLFSVLIAVAGLIAIIYIYTYKPDNLQYAVVFDAGSSHTSMFIYKWEGEKINSTAVAIQDGPKCNAHGKGISSYADNSSGAGESLVNCLDIAANHVPKDRHDSTPVYLGATAGMRLLQKERPAASEAVLQSVRTMIGSYGFKFDSPKQQARIIPGSQEGAFSWITSNYITGTFDVHPPTDQVVPELYVNSVGTLDLGGASTQITFAANITDSVPEENRYSADLYGTNYSLYTHSFLCYGINEAATRIQAFLIEAAEYNSTVNNPCSPVGSVVNVSHQAVFGSACVGGDDGALSFGRNIVPSDDIDQDTVYFLHGESNSSACQALVTELFNFTVHCPYDSCSFNGVYQPPVTGDFFGISSYFYVMQFLNLTESDRVNYTDFVSATQSLCAKDWQQVKEMKTAVPDNLPWYCFQALYIDTILVQGYKFDPLSTWNGIHFVESVSGVDAGWTLGFTIDESNQVPATSAPEDVTTVAFVLLTVLFCSFFILFIFFARLARRNGRSSRRSFSFQRNGYGAI